MSSGETKRSVWRVVTSTQRVDSPKICFWLQPCEQAMVTGEGPWKNIVDHVGDPFGSNMLVNFGNIGGASPF